MPSKKTAHLFPLSNYSSFICFIILAMYKFTQGTCKRVFKKEMVTYKKVYVGFRFKKKEAEAQNDINL